MNDKKKLAHDMDVLRKLNENQMGDMENIKVSPVGTVQEEASYKTIFDELTEVVGGEAVLKVMEILKKHNLVQGELEKDIMWLFNFEGGGWNSVMAKNKEEAIQKAEQEYANSPNLTIMPDTFRPSTKGDYEANMRSFN